MIIEKGTGRPAGTVFQSRLFTPPRLRHPSHPGGSTAFLEPYGHGCRQYYGDVSALINSVSVPKRRRPPMEPSTSGKPRGHKHADYRTTP
ncbi:hypothetical protein ACFOY4_31550 [Actinomadura syzygii]|uniref:Uncharacterized protein n=1 Tax=Actinomadura syzygii TaxID=1427538 RepID=A0A5D0UBD5_9ACTN|nr:hypothetical protein [Actinomadura syzygii]TYC15334.1 hypothetical protein FXF65_14810 [Actinomadura syzygii]